MKNIQKRTFRKNAEILMKKVNSTMGVRKRGASHWLEILGAVLIIVLMIGAFNKFDYSPIIKKFMDMLTGLLDKAANVWK